MKKIFLLLGIVTLLGFNVYIFKKSDSNLKIQFELQNIALADGEGSGGSPCYTSFNPSFNNSYLKCNTPCCYWKDHIPTHECAGNCSGSSFGDC